MCRVSFSSFLFSLNFSTGAQPEHGVFSRSKFKSRHEQTIWVQLISVNPFHHKYCEALLHWSKWIWGIFFGISAHCQYRNYLRLYYILNVTMVSILIKRVYRYYVWNRYPYLQKLIIWFWIKWTQNRLIIFGQNSWQHSENFDSNFFFKFFFF